MGGGLGAAGVEEGGVDVGCAVDLLDLGVVVVGGLLVPGEAVLLLEEVLAALGGPEDVDAVPLSEEGGRLGHEGVVALGQLQGLTGVDLGEVAPGGPLVPVLQLHPGFELVLGGGAVAAGGHFEDVPDQLGLELVVEGGVGVEGGVLVYLQQQGLPLLVEQDVEPQQLEAATGVAPLALGQAVLHGGQPGNNGLDDDGGQLFHEGGIVLVPEDGGDEAFVAVAALLDGEGVVLAVYCIVGEVGEVVAEVSLVGALEGWLGAGVLSVANLAIPSPYMKIRRGWMQVTST